MHLQAVRRNQSTLAPLPPLTVPGVFAALHAVAADSGQGAVARRQGRVLALLRACRCGQAAKSQPFMLAAASHCSCISHNVEPRPRGLRPIPALPVPCLNPQLSQSLSPGTPAFPTAAFPTASCLPQCT